MSSTTPPPDPNFLQRIFNVLNKSIDWKGLSFFGLGSVIGSRLGTSQSPVGLRTEIKPEGLYGWDERGNLSYFISSSLNSKNPRFPTITVGKVILVDLIQSITGAVTIASKTALSLLAIQDSNNGRLSYIGDAGSGNLQFTFDKTTGFTLVTNGKGVTFDGPLTITAGSIQLDNTRHVASGRAQHRYIDDGAATIFVGTYINGALEFSVDASNVTCNLPLKLDNNAQNITTEVLTKFVNIKDATGTVYKVGIVV